MRPTIVEFWGHGNRTRSVTLSWRWFALDTYIDTGYAGSRFEFSFTLSIGAWRYVFDWRPTR